MNNTIDKPLNLETIYIVAGNYTEFKQYVTKKQNTKPDPKNYTEFRQYVTKKQNTKPKPKPKYVYVKDHTTLMGVSNIKGYFIGSYREREDFIEIKNRIDRIKAVDEMTKVLHEMKETEVGFLKETEGAQHEF